MRFLASLTIGRTDKKKDYSSHQWRAYEYFQRKNMQLNDEEIDIMFQNALHKMSVMLVIIVNEVNLGKSKNTGAWKGRLKRFFIDSFALEPAKNGTNII